MCMPIYGPTHLRIQADMEIRMDLPEDDLILETISLGKMYLPKR